MEEWKECKLGDCVSILGDGLHGTPKYTQNGEYAFINGNNFVNGKIIIKPETKRVNENEYQKYKKNLTDRTIFVSINGTIGNVGTYNGEKIILGKSACYFNVLDDIDKTFIRYVVSSSSFKTYLETNATGTTIKNVSLAQMRNYSFLLPPLPTQQKIAAILSSLDDKIELNNKVNTNLEQQANTLFKNWFANENNTNSFSLKQLEEVTENLRERITNQNTPVLSAVNTGKLQRSDEYFSKQVYSKDISKYILVKEGDFAYNPSRVNIGSIGINDLGYDGCVSPVYVAFSVDPDYRSFFKYFIKSNKFKEEAKTRATGSVRQTLNYSDFAKIEIKYPPRDLAKQFEAFHSTIEASKRKIEKETETLISIRDTLLPRLMNGEIEV